MTYFIAEREGYQPKLIQSEQIAKDLARTGWTVLRVIDAERLDSDAPPRFSAKNEGDDR